MTELMGEKAKPLKSQLSDDTGQVTALKELYSVYLQKLETFGVDLSSYGL